VVPYENRFPPWPCRCGLISRVLHLRHRFAGRLDNVPAGFENRVAGEERAALWSCEPPYAHIKRSGQMSRRDYPPVTQEFLSSLEVSGTCMHKRRLSRVFATATCPRKIPCFFWLTRHGAINSARRIIDRAEAVTFQGQGRAGQRLRSLR
jgi:hypothetical protein